LLTLQWCVGKSAFDDPANTARHDKMVVLVERMLALHEKLTTAAVPADKQLYHQQQSVAQPPIHKTGGGSLYGLTEEEITIVEGQDLKSTLPAG